MEVEGPQELTKEPVGESGGGRSGWRSQARKQGSAERTSLHQASRLAGEADDGMEPEPGVGPGTKGARLSQASKLAGEVVGGWKAEQAKHRNDQAVCPT